MFLKEVLSLYKDYKRDHKDEIAKAKLEKRLAQAPLDYRMLAQFMKFFCDNASKQNLVFEAYTKDGTRTRIFFQNGEVKTKTTTEAIMGGF